MQSPLRRPYGWLRRRSGRLTLRMKLGLMMLVPMVVLGAFATGAVRDKLGDRSRAREIRQQAQVASTAGALIHELQLERGRSGIALELPERGMEALIQQRLQTDEAYERFIEVSAGMEGRLDERFDQALFSLPSRWTVLQSHRRLIDDRRIDSRDAFVPYTSLIEALLDLTTLTGTVETDQSASSPLGAAHWDFLHGEERAALTRGILGAAAAAGDLTPQDRSAVEVLILQEQVYFHSFVDRAPRNAVQAYWLTLSSGDVRAALELRARLLSGSALLTAPDGGRLFDVLSAHVDGLFQVEQEMVDAVVLDANARDRTASMTVAVIGSGALLLLLSCFGVLAIGARSIARPLRGLADSARRIAEGDLEADQSEWTNDAIGEIGEAFDDMRDYLREMADVAEDLAWGQLDTHVEPRSSEDTFGNSLAAMTRRLSMTMAESEERAAELERTVERLRASEQELWRAATHDPLTGLPNRTYFMDRFTDELERAHRLGQHVAVAFVDLDRFKQVNDTLGHEAGDELLRHVALRLQRQLRPTDGVARLGGDEFALLLRDVGNDANTIAVLDRLIESLSRPYEISAHVRVCPPSVGVAIFPEDGASPDSLLACADDAMYAAKRSGGGVYRFYSELDVDHRMAG